MAAQTPIWLIVGASSGFCQSIARDVLGRGHKAIVCARKVEALNELEHLGAYPLALDVTAHEQEIASKIKQANEIYGGITHLVNGAAFVLEGMIEEISDDEAFGEFNTNVFGVIKVTRAVLPYMRATETAVTKVIANFGSMGSWTGWVSSGIYCSTKWAISGLTEALAEEVAPFGIKAVIIEPGTFRTELLSSTSGRRVLAERRLDEYKEMRDAVHGFMNATSGAQMGNPTKGATVIVDVLISTGCAEGRDIPPRLLLGSDAIETIKQKCSATVTLIDEWRDVIKSTDIR
ncbi:NAD(P)-binding protein [Polychaeton citri CBS 116435]|uniref:NAD(P)-binding protein n=1 Tax=Polychaeton citri CBS 116435 TaxID=1314669 RepID=A0A9P4Q465_9PEZI|nr:NAD(P)-binding protein [Polychaeton citri CBS 116435]